MTSRMFKLEIAIIVVVAVVVCVAVHLVANLGEAILGY